MLPTSASRANDLRAAIRAATLEPEAQSIRRLIAQADLDGETRTRMSARAAAMVETLRTDDTPGLMEQFLGEYGLSTKEGVALMCLAEALLRVPDAETIDALIQDKIVPADWGKHLGHSSSSLVNASTWALMLTGQVLKEEPEPGLIATFMTWCAGWENRSCAERSVRRCARWVSSSCWAKTSGRP